MLDVPGARGYVVTTVGAWASAAGFALGLSLAGLYTAGVASADQATSDSVGTESTVSAGPHRNPAKASRPARRAYSAVTAAPSARQIPRPVSRSATDSRSDLPVVPVVGPGQDAAPPAEPQCCAGSGSVGPAPAITIHNSSKTDPIWVYNLTSTGNYSIPATPWQAEPPAPAPPLPADWVGPVQIAAGSSAPVTLAVFNAAPGSPGNRIYIVEDSEFTLPVGPTSGIDPFYPSGSPGNDSFGNYSFVEYSLYQADGGYEYTIDVSYIDEWSLPIQTRFTLNGADWTGAVDGKTYGFKDFDTVVSQLDAAGGPYGQLVWNGATPWDPQPPSTVKRIIGPDKVWTAQANEPASNVNMNVTGWVPASYQNFIQYGAYQDTTGQTVYPYAYSGTQLSRPPVPPNPPDNPAQSNFDFWRYQVSAPGSTPYPIALRTAAIHDGFPADPAGVYGFFTYPNDEAAGQFTNIPTSVSLDMYVHGSSDGVSDTVIAGGVLSYTSAVAQTGTWRRMKQTRSRVSGTTATDTFVLNTAFSNARFAPTVDLNGPGGDIAVIDRAALGAASTTIDVVERARFWCGGGSQFVYERSTGTLYYDRNPGRPGHTAVLARFGHLVDPSGTIFVL